MIIGQTGVGKSTFIGLLNQVGQLTTIPEVPPDTNPHWPAAYADITSGVKPSRPMELSQQFFLESSLAQWQMIAELLERGVAVGWEMPPFGHQMYAEKNFEAERITPEFIEWYRQQLVEWAQSLTYIPHAILVLTIGDMDLLHARLAERVQREPHRAGELEVPDEYWLGQKAYLDQLMVRGIPGLEEVPIIHLSAEIFDWKSPVGQQQVLAYLQTVVPGLQLAASTPLEA